MEGELIEGKSMEDVIPRGWLKPSLDEIDQFSSQYYKYFI